MIQPALQAHLPDLAARIEADHEVVADRSTGLVSIGDAVAEATAESRPSQSATST